MSFDFGVNRDEYLGNFCDGVVKHFRIHAESGAEARNVLESVKTIFLRPIIIIIFLNRKKKRLI